MRLFQPHHPVLLAAALALTACQHAQPPQRTARAPAFAETTADPGAPVLAAIQNARAAIAAGDRLAAYNSVAVALSNAVQLTGAESTLFPPEAAPPGYRPPAGGGSGGGSGGGAGGARGGGHGRHRHGAGAGAPPGQASAGAPAPSAAPAGPPPAAAAQNAALPVRGGPQHRHARGGRPGGSQAAGARPGGRQSGGTQAEVTAFDAQVSLISIQAKLQRGDVAGADADLGALEASAARHPAPANLPLIRADQSLTLASAAADNGRIAELKTQLETAHASLVAYQGAPHAADARALAAAIGAALSHPAGLNALPPVQLSLWSGRLGSWV